MIETRVDSLVFLFFVEFCIILFSELFMKIVEICPVLE